MRGGLKNDIEHTSAGWFSFRNEEELKEPSEPESSAASLQDQTSTLVEVCSLQDQTPGYLACMEESWRTPRTQKVELEEVFCKV